MSSPITGGLLRLILWLSLRLCSGETVYCSVIVAYPIVYGGGVQVASGTF